MRDQFAVRQPIRILTLTLQRFGDPWIATSAFTSNENKMSDGGRERTPLGAEVWKSSQKVERTAVRRSLHRTRLDVFIES
jgi:hypothetical protein